MASRTQANRVRLPYGFLLGDRLFLGYVFSPSTGTQNGGADGIRDNSSDGNDNGFPVHSENLY